MQGTVLSLFAPAPETNQDGAVAIGLKGEVPPFTLIDKPFVLPGSDCFKEMQAEHALKSRARKRSKGKTATAILNTLASKQSKIADTFKPTEV